MLLSFATRGKTTSSWPSCRGNEQTGYLDCSFSRSLSAENFSPLILWRFVRKATDRKLEKPLSAAQPAARSHPCLPSVSDRVTFHTRCYSCQPMTVNCSAWSRFAGTREVSCSSCPWGSSILVPAQVPEGSGFSSLWIKRASNLIFFWITCHQL